MSDPFYQTEPLLRAEFVERPNRFIVHFRRGGELGRAYVANPGKMQEILVSGTTLLLAPRPHTKVGMEVVGAHWQSRWPGDEPRTVFLNTGRVNAIAESLLKRRLIAELEGFEIERAEVTVGDSRFDFLLNRGGEKRLVEVKSVTLVEHGLAMFPDATTARGRRHVEELAELAREGRKTTVLFIVQGKAGHFLPDLHNDLEFARTLHKASRDVELLPYVLEPRLDDDDRLVFDGVPMRLEIPWERLSDDTDEAIEDGGLYLAILTLDEPAEVEIDRRGSRRYEPGHYIYIGSAKRNLTKRIERHKRKRKRMHYHFDYLRQAASQVQTFPIRGAAGECTLAGDVATLGERVPSFGSSDCRCEGHLVYCPEDPVRAGVFQKLLTSWRHR